MKHNKIFPPGKSSFTQHYMIDLYSAQQDCQNPVKHLRWNFLRTLYAIAFQISVLLTSFRLAESVSIVKQHQTKETDFPKNPESK